MRPRLVAWPFAVLINVALGACNASGFSPFGQIEVKVTNPGGGNGQVVASDPNVHINCQFTAGSSNPSPCEDTFPDAGGGGVFTLDATPAAGSTFGGWNGCNSSVGTVCTLTFAQSFDTTFVVQARFDLVPAGSHPMAEIRAYNGTLTSGVTVSLQTPYDGTQTLGPMGTSVQVSDSLQVEVGAQFIMSSTIGGKTGSVTCTTTAGIIPDPADTVTTGNALVAIFTDVAGTPILSCIGTTWH